MVSNFSNKVFLIKIYNFFDLVVNNLPVMQEMQVQSMGQEDPLEKEMATHSSILALDKENPLDREAWQATVHKVTSRTWLGE